jgi:uncharacterized protein (DUF362 family)
MERRRFLKWLAADGSLLAGLPAAGSAAEPYRVGVGSSSDPYTAAQRAVTASGQWPAWSIAGRTVVIKPNLVSGKPASSGATTDPHVVRALVDLALQAGAARILILEKAAVFAPCGYNFFSQYHPSVQLIDMETQPAALFPVPGGYVYQALYLPALVADPNVILISAAKLKTHALTAVTLALKNLYGLAPPSIYGAEGQTLPRWDLHARGPDQSAVDLNLARRVNYAVIDAIWGMEGHGPIHGTPVPMNLVLAGLNPLAVDLAGMHAMQIPQSEVLHVFYAGFKGLGPLDARQVALVGDPLTPRSFVRASTPPLLGFPAVRPATISPASREKARIRYWVGAACWTRVEIIRASDAAPAVTVMRLLHDWRMLSAGTRRLEWDGRDDSGAPLEPGTYLVRVQARYNQDTAVIYASNWVTVIG